MYNKQETVRVNSTATVSFGSLCWLTWLVFLILKLTNVLPETFTWFWVWFPFWLPFAIGGALFIIVFIVMMIYFAVVGKD